MGRSGTQEFEFKFGKNWNFDLGNFCIVITRPRPLKICQSVRVLNTCPGRGQVYVYRAHPVLYAVHGQVYAYRVQVACGPIALFI